jgi:hypothetical protein
MSSDHKKGVECPERGVQPTSRGASISILEYGIALDLSMTEIVERALCSAKDHRFNVDIRN